MDPITSDDRAELVALARREIGETNARRYVALAAPVYAPHDCPSWCGIWVRAVWLLDGREVPAWRMSQANIAYLEPTDDPLPGDLIQWRGKLGHQSMFFGFEVVGSVLMIRHVGGNTSGKDRAGRDSFATVAEKLTPARDVLAYFRAPPRKRAPNVDEGKGFRLPVHDLQGEP